jgi:hypothetical protein
MMDLIRKRFRRSTPSDSNESSFSFHVRHGYFVYREGDHSVEVYADMMTTDIDFVVYPNQLDHWMPPHQDEVIPETKKEEILSRLWKWMERQGMKYEVDLRP